MPKPLQSSIKTFLGLTLACLASPLFAQQVSAVGPSRTRLLDWVLVAGVAGLLWLIFYKGLYPLFLRHYRADYCKFLFWSLFLLYALAWVHLSLYVVFDVGFFYPLIRWVALFLSFLWLIWFAVVFFRQRTA